MLAAYAVPSLEHLPGIHFHFAKDRSVMHPFWVKPKKYGAVGRCRQKPAGQAHIPYLPPTMKRFLTILLIIIISPLLYLIFRKDQTHTTEELRQMFETPDSRYLEWRGSQIHYVDQKNIADSSNDSNATKTLLFIHGFGGSFVNWNMVMDELPKEYRQIAIDLPGFGLSDAPDFSGDEAIIDLYMDAIDHLLVSLELDPVIMIGNSLGGYISWETAVRHPEKVDQLILVNAAGYDMDKIGGPLIKLSKTKFFAWAQRKGVPYRLALFAARRSVAQMPDKERTKKSHALLNRRETIETVGTIGASDEIADTNRISLVSHPTFIIWGEADHIIEVNHAHRFHRDIANSELIIYPLIGHVPMIEAPDRFSADVLRFLED